MHVASTDAELKVAEFLTIELMLVEVTGSGLQIDGLAFTVVANSKRVE